MTRRRDVTVTSPAAGLLGDMMRLHDASDDDESSSRIWHHRRTSL